MTLNPPRAQHTQALSDYMPGGKLFEAKNINDSNFRQLLRGLSGELFTAQGYLVTLEQEYFPSRTRLFIEEWESALGIPDECFPGTESLDNRRRDVVVKLASLGIQTANDFVVLAAIYGNIVTVTPLSDESPLPAGIRDVDARYIFVVTGDEIIPNLPPYDVPFSLFSGEGILQCLIERQSQANGSVIFRNS